MKGQYVIHVGVQTEQQDDRLLAAFDQVVCVSGAFGAFRREALDSVDAFDVGGGEDFDLTLRLRANGWRIRDYRTGRKAARAGAFAAAVAGAAAGTVAAGIAIRRKVT